jgi:hypothetical protein
MPVALTIVPSSLPLVVKSATGPQLMPTSSHWANSPAYDMATHAALFLDASLIPAPDVDIRLAVNSTLGSYSFVVAHHAASDHPLTLASWDLHVPSPLMFVFYSATVHMPLRVCIPTR